MDISEFVQSESGHVEGILFVDVDTDSQVAVLDSFPSLSYFSNKETEDTNLHTVKTGVVFDGVESKIEFILHSLVSDGLIDEEDSIGVVADSSALDSLIFTTVEAEERGNTEIGKLFFESRPNAETIRRTLSVALRIVRTGYKGEPVGALFVIGDEDAVLNRSRPLNYNPFGSSDVFIGDEVISASIGEYAKLDGAFIISDSGRVISANRYLEPRVRDADVPSGLGARHMAASGITRSTDAVSIVVSESDQKVRCFVDGEIVMTIDVDDTDLII